MDHRTPITTSAFNTIRTQATAKRSELLRCQKLERKLVALKKRQRLTATYQLVIFVGSCLPTFVLAGVCSCRIILESFFAFMFFVSAIFGMLTVRFSSKRWNIIYMVNLVLSFFCALPMMLLAVLAMIDKEKYKCTQGNIETCKNSMTVILCVNIMLAFVQVVVIFTALKISSRIILNLDERNDMNSKATRDTGNSSDDDVISKDTLPQKSPSICDNKVGYYATCDPTVMDVDYSDVPSNLPPPPPLPPISSPEPSFQRDSSAPTSARYTIPAPPQPPAIVPAGFGVGTCYINDDLCMTGYVNTVCTVHPHPDITSGYVEMHKSTVTKDRHELDTEDYLEMKDSVHDADNKSVANIDTLNIAYEPLTTSPAKQLDRSREQHSQHLREVTKPKPKPKPPNLRKVRPLLLNKDTNQLRINLKSADNQKEDVDKEGYLMPSVITAIRSRREAKETSASHLRKNVEGGIIDKDTNVGHSRRHPEIMLPRLPNRKLLRRSRSEPFINVIEGKFSVINCRGISIDDVNVLTNNRKDDVITQEEESCHYIELWKTSTLTKLKS